jgi:hypothetical protein
MQTPQRLVEPRLVIADRQIVFEPLDGAVYFYFVHVDRRKNSGR